MYIECENCKHEFWAMFDERGKCPNCNNKFDWYWDGEIWSETESCVPVFECESEVIKNHFLVLRDWI